MKSLKMYCFSLSKSNLEKIKKMNYIPVGLGKEKFDSNWLTDSTNKNIGNKNSWYGENTFYYWLWKNNLEENFNTDWLGFCHYRRFWLNKREEEKNQDFQKSIIQEASKEWENYDVVLRDEVFVNGTKFSKVLKHGKKQLLSNPFVFFSKKNNDCKSSL